MDAQQKIELLKEEYFHLQKVVEDFDNKTITIKAWSITGSLAAISAGLIEKSGEASPVLFVVASIASLFFWLIESRWKTFQLAYYGRIGEIEKWFRVSDSEISNLQIASSWSARWKVENKRLFQIMRWPHVALPHVIIVLGGLLLFVWKRWSCG